MPRRPPIDPVGTYHIGSRGSYGIPIFEDTVEHETFLRMYERVAGKYRWRTAAWVLMKNHYHFVVELTDGGLSEGMRELNGGYSRWRNETRGLTGKGHLVRHGYFRRRITTTEDFVGTCAYVDLNPSAKRLSPAPRRADWCSHAATLGLCHPREFHTPATLLQVLDPRPATARALYRALLLGEHARRGHDPSPNNTDSRD